MNVLIVADKVNGKAYAEIINKVHNTKVIGIVNSISERFISDLGNRYTPNVVIFDTAVDYSNSLPYITQTIGNTYSYIKTIVLAEADESRVFPSASVIRGAISSKDIDEMLTKINSNYDSDGSAPTEDLSNRVQPQAPPAKADIKVKTAKPKKQKVKKHKTKGKGFKFNPLFLLPVAALIIMIVIAVTIKSCGNKSADISPTSSTGAAETAATDEMQTTQAVTIAVPATSPTLYDDDREPVTISAPSDTDNSGDNSRAESREESRSDNENNSSDNNSDNNYNNQDNPQSNNENNENNNSGSHSYVTVSKPEYNYNYDDKKEAAVTGVALNYLSKTLTEGESINLYATVSPSDASNKTVYWDTSNSSVVTVSNGYVVSHSVGTAYITARAGSCSASCTIIVKAKETQDSVYITPSTKYCGINEAVTFTLVNCDNCSFNISNPTAVQVIGGGANRIQLKTKSRATVTVTAKNTSTGREYTAKLIIN